MYFIFVDETGDPNSHVPSGSSRYFGLALLLIHSDNVSAIRKALSHFRWLSGMFAEVKKLPQQPIVSLNVLRGIAPLAEQGIIEASGLYLDKIMHYSGRYLTWSDYGIPPPRWPYYLRNYLLRHLLENHFCQGYYEDDSFDLILDRSGAGLTEIQRMNTLNYLNSSTAMKLREPFRIPPIKHLTEASSEYIEALQIAHLLAELVKGHAKNTIMPEQLELSQFLRIAEFLGQGKAE